MKSKFLIIPLMLGVMMTTACASVESTSPENLPESYSVNAEIAQNDITYTALLQRQEGQGWVVTFSQPDTIDGLQITYSAEECNVNFKDIEYTEQRENLPQNGIAQLVIKALDICENEDELECTRSGEMISEKGIVEGADFTVQICDGQLSNMEISKEITVKFSEQNETE